MSDFGKSREIKKLPREADILKHVAEQDIFAHYLGGLPLRAINSPLRTDVKPSFSLFVNKKTGRLLYKDFSTGEVGDCFVFVMRMFDFSRRTDAFNKIAIDFGLTQFQTNSLHKTPKKKLTYNPHNTKKDLNRKEVNIQVRIRDWTSRDFIYWDGKYGLKINQLEYCKVYPISHYFIDGYCRVADTLAYAYLEEKDGIKTFKIYQPLSKTKKWINNNNKSVWELWEQLPDTGRIVVITSSRKDAMVIKSLFNSKVLTACSLQSEGVMPKRSVVEELKNRFQHVFVLYDNDFDKEVNKGKIAAKKLAKEFRLIDIHLSDDLKVKDISDGVHIHGREKMRFILKKLISKKLK